MVRRDQGFILLVVLVVIALMMAAGALLAGSLQYRMWVLRQESRNIHLTALTDAGLAQALGRLAQSHSWPGTGPQAFGGGTVAIDVDFGDLALTRVVVITATYGTSGRSIRAVVQLSDYLPPRVISWQPIAFDARASSP